MNKQVSQIGVAALVLLAALIVGTTYWQTWANAGLADRQDNAIRLVAQFSIKRGKIYAADGKTPFNPLAPKQPQLPAKAKSVIFLYMYGGPARSTRSTTSPA